MKAKLLNFLRWIRILDEKKNQISIVNIACIVVVVKVAMAYDPSVAELGSLLIALIAHGWKRYQNDKLDAVNAAQNENIKQLDQKIKDLADRIGAVAGMVGIKKLNQ